MVKTKGKILIVDDEEIIRSGCKHILELNGYSVDLAEDGQSGLKKILHKEYDLVLTDIMMPKMDGMQLLDEIKKTGKEIVTIVITGYATLESAIDAGRKGAFDYLPKPFNPDEMLAKVERGFEQRDHLREIARLREERDSNLLQCSNERARTLTIINSMSEGVIAINLQRQIVLVNPMASKMLRLSEHRIIGTTIDTIIRNPELKITIIESLDQVESTLCCTRLEFDTVYGRALQASITPIIDENKHCVGSVTVLIDITEEKKIEKMKSDFVKYVSHELKAPLGAIQGYLDIILDGIIASNPEKEKEMLQKARDRAIGAKNLINDLLDLSRIDRKKSLKKWIPVSVADILNEGIEFYKERIEKKSLNMVINIEKNLPMILGNREDLSRLFANLTSNATKYTPEQGSVTIEAKQTNSHIKIIISDTGIGIAKEELTHIFDDFYRAENALSKNITGTGLGLSIAKKIVEDHHGYIDVTSTVNEGSVFTITLPLVGHNKGNPA